MHSPINVGDEVEFVVPTGNFGDILAGYYAKLLGLPVTRLVSYYALFECVAASEPTS